MQRFFSLGGLEQAGRRDQQLPRSFFIDRFNPQRRTGIAIRLQPFCFHAHIAKLSKVLITGRDWYVLSHRAADRKSDISADAQPQQRLRGFRRKTFLFPYCWRGSP
jgi:hypothetical protein